MPLECGSLLPLSIFVLDSVGPQWLASPKNQALLHRLCIWQIRLGFLRHGEDKKNFTRILDRFILLRKLAAEPVKRSWALQGCNPTRNSWLEAGRITAGPAKF